MTPAGIARLKADEGYSLRLYKDVRGRTSIGFGRNLSDEGISADEAALMLANDIERVTAALDGLDWFLDLDPVRRDVLVNLGYNLGVAGLLGFERMIAALDDADYETAADELLNSEAAAQVPPASAGASLRYQRLAAALRSGIWEA